MNGLVTDPASPATSTIGRRIRVRRLELGLSQEALALRADLHWTFIGQVERGTRNLSVHNLIRIAVGLQIDPGELLQGLGAASIPAVRRQDPAQAVRRANPEPRPEGPLLSLG